MGKILGRFLIFIVITAGIVLGSLKIIEGYNNEMIDQMALKKDSIDKILNGTGLEFRKEISTRDGYTAKVEYRDLDEPYGYVLNIKPLYKNGKLNRRFLAYDEDIKYNIVEPLEAKIYINIKKERSLNAKTVSADVYKLSKHINEIIGNNVVKEEKIYEIIETKLNNKNKIVKDTVGEYEIRYEFDLRNDYDTNEEVYKFELRVGKIPAEYY